MATPTLTKHVLPGVLGDILVDVRAARRAEPGPAVVVVHGFKGFKDWGMFPPLADRLARAGLNAVCFNTSGSGVDDRGEFTFAERFGHNTFSAEVEDLGRVVDALEGGGLGVARPTALGIVGHSRGGGIAVLYTATHPPVRALVTWAPISSVERWPAEQRPEWRARGSLDIVNARTGQVLPLYTDVLDDIERHGGGALDIAAAAERVRVPWLVIHGAGDESVSVSEGERLAAAGPRATTRLLRIEGAGHTFGATHPWQGSTPALDQAIDATVEWLGRHLC